VCFYGVCKHRCNADSAVCGQGALIEGSLAYFLPNDGKADLVSIMSPWRRSYTRQVPLAKWEITEKAEGYCDTVRRSPPFDSERALVNLIDLHIFDFIQGEYLGIINSGYMLGCDMSFYIHPLNLL
jgi:Golgi casein kinase, C-terminal, Fam20